MIKKIAFVGSPVKDMERAKKFYGDVLGLKLMLEHEGMWCEYDTPDGKSIGLETFSPDGSPPYMALETDDIAAEVERLKKLDVKVLMDVKDNRVCKMAIIEDSEGHKLMLHEIHPDRAK